MACPRWRGWMLLVVRCPTVRAIAKQTTTGQNHQGKTPLSRIPVTCTSCRAWTPRSARTVTVTGMA